MSCVSLLSWKERGTKGRIKAQKENKGEVTMKKKVLGMLLLSALAAAFMTGCGGKETAGTNESGNESVNSGVSESTAESKTESADGKEIVYWSMWQETEPQADLLKLAIADFEAENPGYTVTVEWTGRTVKDLVFPAMEAGTQVDIFDSDPNAVYKADTEKLMNLDEFYGMDSAQEGQKIEDTLLPGLIGYDTSMAEAAGLEGHYSVPYAPYVVSWFYNREHFEQAGIEKVPETWTEMEEVCAKLKAAGFVPITIDDAYMQMISAYLMQRELGSETVKKMAAEGGEEWNSEGVKKTLDILEDFAAKGYFSPMMETNKFPAGQAEFAMGNASMTMNASWFPAEVSDIAGEEFQWGQFPSPTVEGSNVPITENSIGGQSFFVHAGTQEKEAVLQLLKHMVSEKTQEKFLENNLVPCTVNTEWPETISTQKEIVMQLTANVDWQAGMETELVTSTVLPEINKVIFGKATAEECTNKINEMIK